MDRPTQDSRDDREFQLFLEVARKCRYLFVDTESNGKGSDYDIRDGRGYAMGLSVCAYLPGAGMFSYYFPFRHTTSNLDRSYLRELKTLLESKCLVMHNVKFDIPSLKTLGIIVTDFYCSMLMVHWCNENLMSKALDFVAKHLGIPGKQKSDTFVQAEKVLGWGGLPPSVMAPYAAHDAVMVYYVFMHYFPIFQKEGYEGELWEREKEFIHVVLGMEYKGIEVNQDLAQQEIERGDKRLQEIKDELKLNPGSTKDLTELLINQLGLPVVKETKGGKPSMDKEAMQEYELILERRDSPVAKRVLEYRGYQKTVSSNWRAYLELLSPDGRVRPNYKLHGTKTGRLSCEKPNLQQIPKVTIKDWNKLVKPGFVAPDGFKLWEADYSQLELRLGAAYAKEEELLEVFADDGRDIFTEMALALSMSRFDTKTFVYSTQYGAGVTRIKNVFNISESQARAIRQNYFDTYPKFKKITDMAANKCRSQGYLRLWSGRRRHFDYPDSQAHKAFNSVIQGGSAEIVKGSMLKVARDVCNDECRMLLQVHDSMVFEIAEGKEHIYRPEITRIMNNVEPDFGVRFKTDFHEWGEAA